MTIIFDFDGTLADSFSVGLDVYNQLAAKRKIRIIDANDWEKVRRMSFKQALKFAGARPYIFPGLIKEGKNLFKARAHEIRLFKGLDKVIHKLYKDGHSLYILSSNSEDTIHHVLEAAGVHESIEILKSPPFFGKASAIKNLVKSKKLDQSSTWMVGDELRDGIAANKAGVNFLGVAWGLQPEEILLKAMPKYIAVQPKDILKILARNAKAT